MYRRRGRVRALTAAVAGGAVLMAGYGFTAANTVPDSRAGDGSGTISGYTVSNIDYTLDSADPSLLDAVDFDVDSDPTGSDIKVQLGGTWYDCTNSATAVTCTFPGGSEPTVAGVSSLQVVIAD